MSYDRDRYDRDRYDRDRSERDRYQWDRYDRDDRGVVERAGDEVRSWLGDDEARRRREIDEQRYRNRERAWGSERGYEPDRPYRDRDYGRNEPTRTEGYRDYGDRYGRSYSAPLDRDRYAGSPERSSGTTWNRDFDPNPVFQPYARGSQEFGPEGYGSAWSSTNPSAREGRSTERWRVPGPHVGRGPKGYQRSEERIREEISDRLTAHGLVDASDVEVRIQSGEVTLTGFVDSRDAKRAAEDCAEDVSGVREVHNHLRIRSHADDTGVGRTSVLGLTEHDVQNRETARTLEAREQARGQGDQGSRSRPRNQ